MAERCALEGTPGAACDANRPCGRPLVCTNGTCGQGRAAGETCTSGGCRITDALLFCSGGTNVCQEVSLAGPGQPCGLINGAYVGCAAAGVCRTGTAGAPGTCVAPVADGAACDNAAGPGCMAPATCTEGVCRLPSALTCE